MDIKPTENKISILLDILIWINRSAYSDNRMIQYDTCNMYIGLSSVLFGQADHPPLWYK